MDEGGRRPSREHGYDHHHEPQRQPHHQMAMQQLPLDDVHFGECVDDFLVLFSEEELAAEPFLREYVSEVLARWGRWTARGRAPHLCFEAAALGGLRVLGAGGWGPSERTDRIERALAQAMAGLTVDALEPNAAPIMRSKAVLLLADEFLARAASPKLATPAKKRARKRRSKYPVAGVEGGDEWDISVARDDEPLDERGGSVMPLQSQQQQQSRQRPDAAYYSDHQPQEQRRDARAEKRKGSILKPGWVRGSTSGDDDRGRYSSASQQQQQLATAPSPSFQQQPRRRRDDYDGGGPPYMFPPPPASEHEMMSHVSRSVSLRGASPQPVGSKAPRATAPNAPPSLGPQSPYSGPQLRKRTPSGAGATDSPISGRRPSQDLVSERRPSLAESNHSGYAASLESSGNNSGSRRPSFDRTGGGAFDYGGSGGGGVAPATAGGFDYGGGGGRQDVRRPSVDSVGSDASSYSSRSRGGGAGGGGGGGGGVMPYDPRFDHVASDSDDDDLHRHGSASNIYPAGERIIRPPRTDSRRGGKKLQPK